ncbi:MAG: hypothetical protein H7829_02350 [Magnetococcus sp. THC-1_WYH]
MCHTKTGCVDVYDLEEATGTCGMCGREEIRYVHVMDHPHYPEALDVGCICAGKMTNYGGPRERENRLKNKASRRTRWLSRKWRVSAKGNEFLNTDGFNITIFPYNQGRKKGKWGYKVGERFGNSNCSGPPQVHDY